MAYEKDPNEIGALWLKRGSKGPYMTGEVNGVAVVCFPTKAGGEGTKAPAWRVNKSQPKPDRTPNQNDGPDVDAADIAF